MVYGEDKLQAGLSLMRQNFQKSIDSIDEEVNDFTSWLEDIIDGFKKGTIDTHSVLVPKTPGKQRAPLAPLQGNCETSIIDTEDSPNGRKSRTSNKKGGRKGQKQKQVSAESKVKRPSTLQEEEEEDGELVLKANKRLVLEEEVDVASKRMRLSRTSETPSQDSGLFSVGSRNTGGSGYNGVGVKQEMMSPKDKSLEASTILEEVETSGNKQVTRRTVEITVSRMQVTEVTESSETEKSSPPTVRKRSRSAGRGTFVVRQEDRRSSRSHSEPRTPTASPCKSKPMIDRVSTLQSTTFNLSPSCSAQAKTNDIKSPAVKKIPHLRLVKGDSVKKVVKAFEALNEDHEEAEDFVWKMAPPPAPAPVSNNAAVAITSLDDAVNAPTRLTRTKTRAMAKAAASEEAKSQKDSSSVSAASSSVAAAGAGSVPTAAAAVAAAAKALKSPTQGRFLMKSGEDSLEKESTMGSRFPLKGFGSSSKQNSFLKTSTPLNRIPLLTPSHSMSTSYSTPRLNNLVTSMESFITKPMTCHEQRPTREDNLQKLVAKAEVASKKKEEMIKAQMEERMKKRQEKRLKVCATREAMEREKHEMQQRLEREREEKQRQMQIEREEKLRQEALKRKKMALQKAAETEERRRQEEAARLAKIKQQEEEQRKLAAQKRKEQEEAERRHQERLQQERDAAIHRARKEAERAAKEADRAAKEAERAAKEAERAAKEAASKDKTGVKAQLDQTYDMLPPPQSYGMTPVPEERVPQPPKSADNYGIDDVCTDDSSEDESKPKKQVPLWAQSKQRMPKLMIDCEVTARQMAVFFGSKKCTPDLSKIFTNIDRRQLIRHSSAVWRTPPVKVMTS